MQDQATRSVASALPSGRVLVECAVPELDPSNENFKPQELVSFVHDLAAPLLARARLPKSKDHIKLLFNSMGEATIAGASIMTTSLPVSVLGHPSAIGPAMAHSSSWRPLARAVASIQKRRCETSPRRLAHGQ